MTRRRRSATTDPVANKVAADVPLDHDAWARELAEKVTAAIVKRSKPKTDAFWRDVESLIEIRTEDNIADRMKTNAKRGAAARHSGSAKLQQEAILLYSRGQWKSKKAAAAEIFTTLQSSQNWKKSGLTTSNGQTTIYKWLLAVKRM